MADQLAHVRDVSDDLREFPDLTQSTIKKPLACKVARDDVNLGQPTIARFITSVTRDLKVAEQVVKKLQDLGSSPFPEIS
ncbi:MAG: hypothetical protein F4Y02_02135 [Chloroflexi bacterium]|nr:hypothetical protein [Chloroflexota bacterium]